MPFPNFHAARVKEPGRFQNIVVLKKLKNGIMIYGGKLKGKTTTTAQSYRFPKAKFTVAQAKTWLREHEIKPILFEPAKKDDFGIIDTPYIQDPSSGLLEKDEWNLDTLDTIEMSWDTREKVQELIDNELVNLEASWDFTSTDQNKLLGENGDEWDSYASIHLGRDIRFERDDKRRYLYPVIKDGMVFKEALIKAKKQALKDETWMIRCIDYLLGTVAKYEGISNTDRIDSQAGSTSVSRADFMFEDFMTEKFDTTPEGFLTGKAVITNVGVFTYKVQTEDGVTVQRELRLPEEVFDPDSVQSLKMSPLTNNHPLVKVNSENAKELSVGFIGDSVNGGDSYHLSAPITITDAETVQEVREGKRALSAAYSVDLEMTPGVWMGVPYDAIQRNIRYNHVAVVDRGRAGDDAVMKLDSVDAICVDMDRLGNKKNSSRKEDTMSLKKITIDGVEYEAEAKVIETLSQARTKIDEMEKSKEEADKIHTELQAKHDTLKDERDQLKKDKEELEKSNPEKIDEAVKAKLILRDTAKKFDIEVEDEMSDEDIKHAVIIKAYPNAKEKLDDAEIATEDYIQARFDAAVEYLEENIDVGNENKKKALDHSDNGNDQEEKVDAEKSRQDMIKRMENAGNDEDGK
jgi:hypothetical protein